MSQFRWRLTDGHYPFADVGLISARAGCLCGWKGIRHYGLRAFERMDDDFVVHMPAAALLDSFTGLPKDGNDG